jgi:DNA-binding ferritin-like protein
MEITVNIPDEVAEMARARGMTPETYVEGLIDRDKPKEKLAPSVEERMANLERFFKEISANSHKIPRLPDEAFTRDSFYSDHD